MTTRTRWDAGSQIYYEDIGMETVQSLAPLVFNEEFIGGGHTAGFPAAGSPIAGYPWVKKIVGAAPPTAALVSNAAGGQSALTLLANSEKEEATLYWNDNLSFDITKRFQIEWTNTLTVAPSAAGVQAVFGVAQAWIDGPDNNARYLEFGFTANNTLLCRSKDGVNTYSVTAALIATPTVSITVDTNPHLYRIDVSDPTDVAFYFDGNRVNAKGTVTWGATSANSLTQIYASVYKPSGTGLATLTIDRVDAWSNRR
jgi:hypothetical protein